MLLESNYFFFLKRPILDQIGNFIKLFFLFNLSVLNL